MVWGSIAIRPVLARTRNGEEIGSSASTLRKEHGFRLQRTIEAMMLRAVKPIDSASEAIVQTGNYLLPLVLWMFHPPPPLHC